MRKIHVNPQTKTLKLFQNNNLFNRLQYLLWFRCIPQFLFVCVCLLLCVSTYFICLCLFWFVASTYVVDICTRIIVRHIVSHEKVIWTLCQFIQYRAKANANLFFMKVFNF